MAIDLDVIPSVSTPLRWGELKRMIHGMVVDHEARQLAIAVINLRDLQSKRPIQDGEGLACPGYYYFELAQDATLSLVLEPNIAGWEDIDYLDDFARNVTLDVKKSIQRRWQQAGFLATVSSNGGRTKGELELLVQVARCVAKLTNGYMVVKDNGVFTRPVGLYHPDGVAFSPTS